MSDAFTVSACICKQSIGNEESPAQHKMVLKKRRGGKEVRKQTLQEGQGVKQSSSFSLSLLGTPSLKKIDA